MRPSTGVNPLTVLKSYQQLADEQLVEKRRGLGMFINTGARRQLLEAERRKFLVEHMPANPSTIRRLGLSPQELLAAGEAPPEPALKPTPDPSEER